MAIMALKCLTAKYFTQNGDHCPPFSSFLIYGQLSTSKKYNLSLPIVIYKKYIYLEEVNKSLKVHLFVI